MRLIDKILAWGTIAFVIIVFASLALGDWSISNILYTSTSSYTRVTATAAQLAISFIAEDTRPLTGVDPILYFGTASTVAGMKLNMSLYNDSGTGSPGTSLTIAGCNVSFTAPSWTGSLLGEQTFSVPSGPLVTGQQYFVKILWESGTAPSLTANYTTGYSAYYAGANEVSWYSNDGTVWTRAISYFPVGWLNFSGVYRGLWGGSFSTNVENWYIYLNNTSGVRVLLNTTTNWIVDSVELGVYRANFPGNMTLDIYNSTNALLGQSVPMNITQLLPGSTISIIKLFYTTPVSLNNGNGTFYFLCNHTGGSTGNRIQLGGYNVTTKYYNASKPPNCDIVFGALNVTTPSAFTVSDSFVPIFRIKMNDTRLKIIGNATGTGSVVNQQSAIGGML